MVNDFKSNSTRVIEYRKLDNRPGRVHYYDRALCTVYYVYDLNDFPNCLTDNRNRTDDTYVYVGCRLHVDDNIEKHRIFVMRV